MNADTYQTLAARTLTFTDKDAFLAALSGKQRKSAKAARPDLPRAEAGAGDRLSQITRIATYGFSPRYRAGVGFDFWQPGTGRSTIVCAEYAEACVAAEAELKRVEAT